MTPTDAPVPIGRRDSGLWRALAWIGLAVLPLLLLLRIGGYVLQDPDEGRYAEIPREMVESGDWVTPRLNYVKYFEKPPLLYWSVAASYRAFGISEGAARLTPALSGIATVVCTYLLGVAAFGRRAAWLGAAILATAPLFFVFTQVLVTDMLLTACMTATLAGVFAAHRAERKDRWAALVALATALGVLTKGPVALVLPGGIALAFLASRRDWKTAGALLRPTPILVFAVVTVPWFVLVSLRNPEFPQFFFVRENFQRFASEGVGHPNGPFYYLPAVLLGPLPWSLLAGLLLLRREARAAIRSIEPAPRDLFALWAGMVLVFFTIASSKLPGYILPAYPPLALLTGAFLDRVIDDESASRGALRIVGGGLAGLGAIAVVVGALTLVLSPWLGAKFDVEPVGLAPFALACLGSGLALLAAGAASLRREVVARLGQVGVVLLLTSGLAVALFAAMGVRALAKTSRELAAAIDAETTPGDESLVAAYRKFMQSLSFYSRRRVTQVMASNEIEPGMWYAPDREQYFWDEIGPLQEAWSSGRKVFVATGDDMLPQLEKVLDPKPRLLARNGGRVLLVNFPAAPAGASGARAGQGQGAGG